MSYNLPDVLAYYTRPGPLTNLPDNEAIRDLLAGLPTAIPALVQAVQNNLIHIFWAEQYGVKLSDERKAEVNIRTAAAEFERIHAMNPAPLTVTRDPGQRLVGNCRDFSLLLCALLREKGIPARARCGFGSYFEPLQYIDHWVGEYWNADQNRWIMVDAQLDLLQGTKLHIDFDPLDVPHSRFITGGHAWQMCRQEDVSPERFGIFDMRGLWFICGDMLRDFAALNKVELLPWDSWGMMFGPGEVLAESALAFLDHIAALTLGGNESFSELRAVYNTDARVSVPPIIQSFPNGPQPIPVTLANEPGWSDEEPATKAALLDMILTQRRRLETALALLSDAEMTQPNVVGFWSVKDVLAHIASWEQRFLQWVRAGQNGEPSGHLEPSLSQEEVDRLNQESYEQYRDLSLDETRSLFASSYRDTLAALDAMSEDEIFRVGHYAWTGKWAMLSYLRANTDGHYAEHAEQIEAWRR